MWAFGTGPDGLGLSTLEFWLLTSREFWALKARWNIAHGMKPPMTREQKAQLEANKNYILGAQIRAYERRQSSKLRLVEARRNG